MFGDSSVAVTRTLAALWFLLNIRVVRAISVAHSFGASTRAGDGQETAVVRDCAASKVQIQLLVLTRSPSSALLSFFWGGFPY